VYRHFNGRGIALAEESWTHAEPVAVEPAPAFTAALVDALELLDARASAVALTRLYGACAQLPFALVHTLGKPVPTETAGASPFARGAAGTLVLNTAHRDFDRLAPLFETAPRLAAMLVARRVAVAFGKLDPDADKTLTGWALS
jgi:hypothetical protein